jgi:hypothetical protein
MGPLRCWHALVRLYKNWPYPAVPHPQHVPCDVPQEVHWRATNYGTASTAHQTWQGIDATGEGHAHLSSARRVENFG